MPNGDIQKATFSSYIVGLGLGLVLLRISKSCKRTDSDEFLKNPRIRTRIQILDESIINMCLQTCSLVSVYQTAANGVKQYLSQATSTATN